MKKIFLAMGTVALLASCNNSAERVAGASDSVAGTKLAMDSASITKRWMESMMPKAEHQFLASHAGTWYGDMTMWMSPNAQPEMAKDTMTSTSVLDGRFEQSTHRSNFGGMPFMGHGTMGFDNIKGKFVSTWMDNMSTCTMIQEGVASDSMKTLELSGVNYGPMTWGPEQGRTVYHFTDSAHFTMEMYAPDTTGKEFKMMEIKYTKM